MHRAAWTAREGSALGDKAGPRRVRAVRFPLHSIPEATELEPGTRLAVLGACGVGGVGGREGAETVRGGAAGGIPGVPERSGQWPGDPDVTCRGDNVV